MESSSLILSCFAGTTERSEYSLFPPFPSNDARPRQASQHVGSVPVQQLISINFTLGNESILTVDLRLHPRPVQRIDNQQSHAGTNPQALRSYQQTQQDPKDGPKDRAHVSPSMLSPSVVMHRTANDCPGLALTTDEYLLPGPSRQYTFALVPSILHTLSARGRLTAAQPRPCMAAGRMMVDESFIARLAKKRWLLKPRRDGLRARKDFYTTSRPHLKNFMPYRPVASLSPEALLFPVPYFELRSLANQTRRPTIV